MTDATEGSDRLEAADERENPRATPAPWRYAGDAAYALLYRLPRELLVEPGVLPEELRDRFVGGTSAVILADYAESAVGPHRELLFVPGRFRSGQTSYFAVTCSYVSSLASAASGRPNWGLPRRVAKVSFERASQGDLVTVVDESCPGRTIAAFSLRPGLLGLHLTTDMVPASRRTILQVQDGRDLLTTPSARGTVRRAYLESAVVEDDSGLPDLSRHQPVAAVRLESFHLTLPRARVAPPGAPPPS
jgi:hypothetical protein